METPDDIALAYIAQRVRERKPERLLLIEASDSAHSQLADAATEAGTVTAERLSAADALSTPGPTAPSRYDAAIVFAPAFSTLATDRAQQLLSRLRDQLADTVIACVDTRDAQSADWTIARFIGLGFRRSADSRGLDTPIAIYRYDIHDYKTTPDWLNSRYWANPERWDRDRW